MEPEVHLRVTNPRDVDLDISRTSHGSRDSAISTSTLPAGTRIGKSGMFVIGTTDPAAYVPSIRDSASLHSSVTALSQPSTLHSHKPIVDKGYDFEEWNWTVIRYGFILLTFTIMVSLLAAVIGLSVTLKGVCSPNVQWWQGTMMYHVPVPVFYDYDKNTHGDFEGLIRRIPYLRYLGVQILCLSSFMPSEIPTWDHVSDFRTIDKRVGTMAQFDDLLNKLHREGIRLMIEWDPSQTGDLHQWFIMSKQGSFEQMRTGRGNKYSGFYKWADRPEPSEKSMWTFDTTRNQYYYHRANNSRLPIIDWTNHRVHYAMAEELKFWMQKGVDGIFVRSLDQFYIERPITMISILMSWRNVLDKFHTRQGKRILMIPFEYVNSVQQSVHNRLVQGMLEQINLLYMPLKVQDPIPPAIMKNVETATEWRKKSQWFWINWHLGDLRNTRQSDLAALELTLVCLPGTVSITAGQEAGKAAWDGKTVPHGELQWQAVGKNIVPYQPGSKLNGTTIEALRDALLARKQHLALRMDQNFVEDSARLIGSASLKFLEVTNNTMFVKRSYARKDSFFLSVNFGKETTTRDWFPLTPSGVVAADTQARATGVISFQRIITHKEQALLIRVTN